MSEFDCFVESTVLAVNLNRASNELRLEASCPFIGGAKRAIVVSGIDALLIDDLREYNIIDRATVFSATDAIEQVNDCTKCLFWLMQKREVCVADFVWPAYKDKLALIRAGRLELMEIEPVAGASIVVLAKRIEIA